MAVNRPDADARFLCNLSHGSIHSEVSKHGHGRLKQCINVALSVNAHASIRPTARRQTIALIFFLAAHHVPP